VNMYSLDSRRGEREKRAGHKTDGDMADALH
jgi:hypothetical protein